MTKRDLQEYRALCKEIDRLDQEKEQWESKAEKMTTGYSLAPGGGGEGGSFTHAVEKILELKEQIGTKTIALIERRDPIVQAIDALDNDTYRELLTLRYLWGWTWEKVAERMNYSRMHTCRLHGKALEKIKML